MYACRISGGAGGGAKISDEVLPELFEPFVTAKPKETGLGLAFCKKVAVAHGATIEGRNVDGGVEFVVGFKS